MYVTKYRIRLHIILNVIFWIGMYLFWLGFNRSAMPDLKVDIIFTFVDFICFSLIAIGTAYYLIPRFLYRRKYLYFGVLYTVLLTAVCSVMVYCNYLMLKPYRPEWKSFSYSGDFKDVAGSYLLAFFLSSASCIFKLVDDFYTNQSDITKLREEKVQAELEFLKLQVSPHSFFNILNTIYFQIDLDRESAKKSVMQFSNMFRYQLYECRTDKVCITNEMKFLKSYIDISKTRFDTDYSIDFRVQNAGDPSIAPFLLFPLVENSFKHVSQYADRQNTIDILIKYDEAELECCIQNTCEHAIAHDGIGLNNLKRRLELLYKGRHTYLTKYEKGMYQTQLKILL